MVFRLSRDLRHGVIEAEGTTMSERRTRTTNGGTGVKGDRAVVLGGSVAGVLAARVLAKHYRSVTVVDRDTFPEEGVHRRGVPQDRHIHALQTRGKRAIEQLFPGVTAALAAEGGVVGEWGRDSTMCFAGHRLRPVEADLDLLAASRPLLEGHLRARLGQLPNVTYLEAHGAHGLVVDAGDGRVTGVRLLPLRAGAAEETRPADLVVDATGRGSRLPRWLEDAGYGVPDDDESGLGVVYTSARFPRHASDDKHAIIVSALPPDGRRGGGAIAVEGDSWIVTLGGVQGEQAPSDLEGFRDYAATLAIPDIHELIRDREPLGDFVVMRYATGRRRRYEQLDRFPDGLVVLGDALCSFNPVYGQGMSVAAVEALALDACLEHGAGGIGTRFLAAVQTVVDDAWDLAAGGDAQYVDAGAPTPLPQRLVGRYQRRMLAVAQHDPEVSRAFREVMAMVARPPAILRPRIAARVLLGSLRARDDARTWPSGAPLDPVAR